MTANAPNQSDYTRADHPSASVVGRPADFRPRVDVRVSAVRRLSGETAARTFKGQPLSRVRTRGLRTHRGEGLGLPAIHSRR